MPGPFVRAACVEMRVLCADWLDLYPAIQVSRDHHGYHVALRAGYAVDDPLGWDRLSVFAAIHSLLEQEEMRRDQEAYERAQA